MELYIDGKKAVLKAGASFDYVSENRAFTDSDAYSLAITIPIAGCQQNHDIFGDIQRLDCNSRKIVLDAYLADGAFDKMGVISVVEANESELKVQFLEGRSAQNFEQSFDDVYINDLDLGDYPENLPDWSNELFKTCDEGIDYIPFVWVNDSADGFLNNGTDPSDSSGWDKDTRNAGKLSYMPYLLFITKKICDAIGFSYDLSPWESSDDRFLILCNALPAAWDLPEIARALPHWSVPEFFAQLENFLVCEFDINYKLKHISMRYSADIESLDKIVNLENVVDDFSSEISYKDMICKYKAASRIHYADRGDQQWKFQSCSWFIELMSKSPERVLKFNTEKDYKDWFDENRSHFGYTIKEAPRGLIRGKLFYIEETNTYFIWHVKKVNRLYDNPGSSTGDYMWERIFLNWYGDMLYYEDTDETVELKIVPVRRDSLSDVYAMSAVFLQLSDYAEVDHEDDNGVTQPYSYAILSKEIKDKEYAEYFDKIFVGYWGGGSSDYQFFEATPWVDERLKLSHRYKNYQKGIIINPKEKVSLKFIADNIPDVRAVFHIRGRRYLCEKITATFTDKGMSQLMKGEFYPIID